MLIELLLKSSLKTIHEISRDYGEHRNIIFAHARQEVSQIQSKISKGTLKGQTLQFERNIKSIGTIVHAITLVHGRPEVIQFDRHI